MDLMMIKEMIMMSSLKIMRSWKMNSQKVMLLRSSLMNLVMSWLKVMMSLAVSSQKMTMNSQMMRSLLMMKRIQQCWS